MIAWKGWLISKVCMPNKPGMYGIKSTKFLCPGVTTYVTWRYTLANHDQ